MSVLQSWCFSQYHRRRESCSGFVCKATEVPRKGQREIPGDGLNPKLLAYHRGLRPLSRCVIPGQLSELTQSLCTLEEQLK